MSFLASFSILLYLAGGLLIGWFVFPRKWLKVNNWLIMAGISLTLFSMGASIGGSPTFFEDIATAGGQAFVIALAAIIGSVLLVFLITKFFFGGRKQ